MIYYDTEADAQMTNYATVEAWRAKAVQLFGDDPMQWKFVCPSCGHIARVQDWKEAGATEGEVAFSCVGRRLTSASTIGQRPGPCNYAGGGLIRLNPVTVGERSHNIFQFANEEIP